MVQTWLGEGHIQLSVSDNEQVLIPCARLSNRFGGLLAAHDVDTEPQADRKSTTKVCLEMPPCACQSVSPPPAQEKRRIRTSGL